MAEYEKKVRKRNNEASWNKLSFQVDPLQIDTITHYIFPRLP
jgi:hypothetical protein